jgi:hypothetical protein
MNGRSLLPATGTGNGLFINITIDEGVDGSPNGCKRYTQRVKKWQSFHKRMLYQQQAESCDICRA